MGWEKIIENEAELTGLPESALQAAKQSAENKGLQGYRFTLEIPSYLPVMTYCENRALREEIYRAYATRASEQGPNAGKWDNSKVMEEILTLRNCSVLIPTPNFPSRPKWHKTLSKCWIS